LQILSRLPQDEFLKSHRSCDLIAHYAPDFGVGLYAAQDLPEDYLVENSYGLLVRMDVFEKTAIMNYGENLNDTYTLLTLGNSLLINHCDEELNEEYVRVLKGISNITQEDLINFGIPEVDKGRTNIGDVYDIVFRTMSQVKKGNQLFITYGSPWFTSRDIKPLLPSYTYVQDIENSPGRLPGCKTKLTYFDKIEKRLVVEISNNIES